ncbi:hypothetical protein E4U52_004275 [Claviceps spartinae]|nr:hypothetical protein E4U52_004275 [Claviceps spartinae]
MRKRRESALLDSALQQLKSIMQLTFVAVFVLFVALAVAKRLYPISLHPHHHQETKTMSSIGHVATPVAEATHGQVKRFMLLQIYSSSDESKSDRMAARHTIICIDINVADTLVSKPDETPPWPLGDMAMSTARRCHVGINTATAA